MVAVRLFAIPSVVPLILRAPARADDLAGAALTFEFTKISAALPSDVSGGNSVTAGHTKTSGQGEVLGLAKFEDFDGNCGKLGAARAFVVGKEVAVLENEATKVKIHLTADQEDVEIDLGAGGPGFALQE